MAAAFGVDQLDVDLNLLAQPPHAAFQHIANAKLAADLPDIDRFALVGKGGGAEITKLPTMRDRSVVRSSVIASTKYSCSGSLDRLAKGRTTIDRRGGGFASVLATADGRRGLGGAETGGVAATAIALIAKARTGRAMFLTFCSPMSAKA